VTRGSEKILRTTSVGANPQFSNDVKDIFADHICAGTLTTMKDGAPNRSVMPTVHPPTYVELYRVLAKALKGDGDSPVKPEGARDVLRIIEAAIASSKEGRTIVL
jgi:predicted dehydrogenase